MQRLLLSSLLAFAAGGAASAQGGSINATIQGSWVVDGSATFDISGAIPTALDTCVNQFGLTDGRVRVTGSAGGVDAVIAVRGFDRSSGCSVSAESSGLGISRRSYAWLGDPNGDLIGEVEISASAEARATVIVSEPRAGAYVGSSARVDWFWSANSGDSDSTTPIAGQSGNISVFPQIALEAFAGDLAPLTSPTTPLIAPGAGVTLDAFDGDSDVIPCIRAFVVVSSCGVEGGASLNGRPVRTASATADADSLVNVQMFLTDISKTNCP